MQRHSASLLWWIIAALSAIVIALSAYLFLTNPSKTSPSVAKTHHVDAPATSKLATQASSEPVIVESEFKPTPNKVLVEEKLLTEPLPTNSSLAKEEIAKQQDIQQQLIAQEKVLQQQNLTADELIRLKEQQIKLLEQQLTEFETTN